MTALKSPSRLLVLALVASVAAGPVSAQMTVYDPAAVAQAIESVSQLKAQLTTLTNTYQTVTQQLSQAQAAYASVTGNRGMGDVFNNPAIRKYLPADMQKAWDTARKGGLTGMTGSVSAILDSEALNGTVKERQAALRERSRNQAAAYQLMAQDAYAGAEARMDQLDQLAAQINATQDPKAIAELQARISIEQARINAEAQKLTLMSNMAAAQDRLAQEQAKELRAKVWSSANTAMPSLKN